MQYSAQRWVNAEDITSAIERLSGELSDLKSYLQHSLVYDTNVYLDVKKSGELKM